MKKFGNKFIKKSGETSGAPAWLVTYGDMVTLLLAFFILLLSFANMDKQKFSAALMSFKGAMGVLERDQSVFDNASQAIDSQFNVDAQRRIEILEALQTLEDQIEHLGLEDAVAIEGTADGILIKMGDKLLFDKGKAKLKRHAFSILKILGTTLRDHVMEVHVSGHTDNVPIHNDDFESNWELSATRALSVVHYLIDETGMAPDVLAAVGYSEYKPIDTNTTDEGRQVNRRVEILVTWK